MSEANPPPDQTFPPSFQVIQDQQPSVVEQYSLINDLLCRIPDSARDLVFVVGGQALMFWSMKYAQTRPSPLEFSEDEAIAIASMDLDLYARDKQAIEACAERWVGKATYPKFGDNTPQSAIVLLNLPEEDEPYKIDFMESVQGVPQKHIEAFWDGFVIGGETVRFLSPPLCLASRIHNFATLGYGPDKAAREAIRINTAIKITKCYLSELLDEHYLENNGGTPRHALNILKFLSQLFEHDDTVEAVLGADADPTLCIPAAHRGWPQRTRDEQIPRIIGKAYDKYRRRAMLRYRHLKPGNAAPIGIHRWLPTGHAT
ncbi:hypothetical protein [Marinobacter sp.]|uniref:hypothetical protein n=1 Tax=Marinobacter sp. TaxID=50741 RepID=UPI003A8EAD0B